MRRAFIVKVEIPDPDADLEEISDEIERILSPYLEIEGVDVWSSPSLTGGIQPFPTL